MGRIQSDHSTPQTMLTDLIQYQPSENSRSTISRINSFQTQEERFIDVVPEWGASCSFQNDPVEIQSPQLTRLKIHHRCDTPTLLLTEQCIQNVTKTNQVLSIKLGSWTNMENFLNQTNREQNIDKFKEQIFQSLGRTIEKEKAALVDLLEEFCDIFSTRPGLNSLYPCRFTVSEHSPFKVRSYSISFTTRATVNSELKRILNWGVIERSTSSYSNSVICVSNPMDLCACVSMPDV